MRSLRWNRLFQYRCGQVGLAQDRHLQAVMRECRRTVRAPLHGPAPPPLITVAKAFKGSGDGRAAVDRHDQSPHAGCDLGRGMKSVVQVTGTQNTIKSAAQGLGRAAPLKQAAPRRHIKEESNGG
ncbi:hypothetical protein SKAU_G00402780 [Synaphobranchus kaupii]|uniref:Uncharacterized protein n=1 Tax=Synaphobranchus kaupii TaxID=118154 RepID=A0A9Q1E9C7_SYNKA|nr:hypothetical protein SKAU_G00402780 [Synaphobranchus kaupii]